MTKSHRTMHCMLLLVLFAAACAVDGPPEDASTSTAAAALVAMEDGGGGDGGGWDTSGGGGTGGTTTIPPFDPPAPPFLFANLPIFATNVNPLFSYSCGQVPHAFTAFSNDFPRGTTIFGTGVVVPHTVANFGIYNVIGQLVKTHLTRPAQDNCVISHEPETIDTSGLVPGYYYVYASFWKLSPNGVDGPFLSGQAIPMPGQLITVMRVR